MFYDFDRFAMQRALALAARGLATTQPNPRVGCVIAQRGRVVGEGWHEQPGEAHAEVLALRAAGAQAAGATAYVTLEPCNHHGRTPPCVDALIQARVARVVYAVADPNPLVNGRGDAALRAAGITVESGLMEQEATDLNVGFMQRMRTGRPWVRVKLAMSLDGRTALENGSSQWITGEAAREDVHRWRARSSAIMTGVSTVLADDPRLNVRLSEEGGPSEPRPPLRVVLDGALRTPPEAQLFSTAGEVLILTAVPADDPRWEPRCAALAAQGARIETLPAAADGLALPGVLERLGELEVNELQVEAGATLAGQLLRQRLADELLLYVAPKLLGPHARPLVNLPPLQTLEEAPGFALVETQQIGTDVRLRLRTAGS
ncbi:MAG: bifunctional diaminohydroxyphosphoribosylaminopyrimidine deaminase/5-amino-6-(5-phosphoribosylamino)uracil reductase RibD [Steroidobacteraceae bacterium]